MKSKNPVPATPQAWLDEVARAYVDAHEAIPFGPLAGTQIKERDLFQLAPAVCLKFRGIKAAKSILDRTTEAALCSYVATEAQAPEVFAVSQLAFAFCYLASHFGLDLLDEAALATVMDHVEQNQAALKKLTAGLLAAQDRMPPADRLVKPLHARNRSKRG